MNIIEIRNLIVTSTGKKGYFKLTGKNKSVDGKKKESAKPDKLITQIDWILCLDSYLFNVKFNNNEINKNYLINISHT